MRAYLMCILVVVFYSGNILVGKALADLPPFTIAFLRVAIAFVVLLPFGYRGARQAAPRCRSNFRLRAPRWNAVTTWRLTPPSRASTAGWPACGPKTAATSLRQS